MGAASASPRPRGRLIRAFLVSTAVLSLVVGVVGGYGYATYLAAKTTTIGPEATDSNGSPLPQPDYGPCVNKVCNYLILGSDSRIGLPAQEQQNYGSNKDIGGSTRSDVIMLVHTDPDHAKATVLSFPRDLWVPIAGGGGSNKINAAFEKGLRGGGPQVVVKTVEDLTGIHINHWLYVDLARFQHIVQVLHGVDMCISAENVNTPGYLTQSSATGDTQVYYPQPGHIVDPNTGLDIMPGCQRLDAVQALAYVRTRHLPCDNIPDFSRIGRQQQFLRAVLNRLLAPSEIAKAPSLIRPIAQNLATDQTFQLADVIYLLGQLRGISTGNVDFRTVPGTTANVTVPWSSIPLSVVQAEPSAEELFRALRTNHTLPASVGVQLPSTTISEAQISVPVVDHGSGGEATSVETVLSDAGFNVAPGVQPYAAFGAKVNGSVIAYEKGHNEEASVLGKYFSNLKQVEVPVHSLHGSPVAMFVTSSYQPQPVGTGSRSSGCVSPTG
jgi:LCP family protein required for cell wall assembly